MWGGHIAKDVGPMWVERRACKHFSSSATLLWPHPMLLSHNTDFAHYITTSGPEGQPLSLWSTFLACLLTHTCPPPALTQSNLSSCSLSIAVLKLHKGHDSGLFLEESCHLSQLCAADGNNDWIPLFFVFVFFFCFVFTSSYTGLWSTFPMSVSQWAVSDVCLCQ